VEKGLIGIEGCLTAPFRPHHHTYSSRTTSPTNLLCHEYQIDDPRPLGLELTANSGRHPSIGVNQKSGKSHMSIGDTHKDGAACIWDFVGVQEFARIRVPKRSKFVRY